MCNRFLFSNLFVYSLLGMNCLTEISLNASRSVCGLRMLCEISSSEMQFPQCPLYGHMMNPHNENKHTILLNVVYIEKNWHRQINL